MNKTLHITIAGLLFTCMGGYALNNHAFNQNGQQSCAQRYPTTKYCYPIHADQSLKPNEILIIKYADSPTIFSLLSNQTGFTAANKNPLTLDQIKVSLGILKNRHQVTIEKTLYDGNLGINRIGLTCNSQQCMSWSS